MGIIPDETLYGTDCLLCFPPDLTPIHLKAFFSGIQQGALWVPIVGLPPNGYFDLENTVEDPCTWHSDQEIFPTVSFTLAAGRSSLKITTHGVTVAFLSNVFVNCIFHHTNDLLCALPNKFCGGYGYVTTVKGIVEIVEELTPMIDPDPRMELFPMADELIAIRYAGKRDATNIMIKFDTDP